MAQRLVASGEWLVASHWLVRVTASEWRVPSHGDPADSGGVARASASGSVVVASLSLSGEWLVASG